MKHVLGRNVQVPLEEDIRHGGSRHSRRQGDYLNSRARFRPTAMPRQTLEDNFRMRRISGVDFGHLYETPTTRPLSGMSKQNAVTEAISLQNRIIPYLLLLCSGDRQRLEKLCIHLWITLEGF